MRVLSQRAVAYRGCAVPRAHRRARARRVDAATSTASPARSALVAGRRARQSSPWTKTEPVAADDAVLADDRRSARRATGLRRTCDAFAIANAQTPPSTTVERDHERHASVVRRRRVVEEHEQPDRRARSARDSVSAPWLGTCSVEHEQRDAEQDQREPGPARSAAPRSRRAPSGARPRRARPGRTTPGWKISKPIPAIPARKSSEMRFGSISVLSSRVRNPGSTSSICAPARWSVNAAARLRLVAVELAAAARAASARRRRSRSSAAPRSRGQVRRLAHGARRPTSRCGRGSPRAPRSEAAASLITLRRRSLPMFWPLDVDRRRGADVRRPAPSRARRRPGRSRRRPRRRARPSGET